MNTYPHIRNPMIHTPDHPGMIPVDDGKSKDLGDLNIIGSGALAMGKHGPGSWGNTSGKCWKLLHLAMVKVKSYPYPICFEFDDATNPGQIRMNSSLSRFYLDEDLGDDQISFDSSPPAGEDSDKKNLKVPNPRTKPDIIGWYWGNHWISSNVMATRFGILTENVGHVMALGWSWFRARMGRCSSGGAGLRHWMLSGFSIGDQVWFWRSLGQKAREWLQNSVCKHSGWWFLLLIVGPPKIQKIDT